MDRCVTVGVRTPPEVVQLPGVPPQKLAYWRYQYRLAKEYLIPLLREWGFEPAGRSVLDVGSAEAGALMAFAEEGAIVCGLELNPHRVELARQLAKASGFELDIRNGNFLDLDMIKQFPGPYDLVLLRDVLEHLPDKATALGHIRQLLGQRGVSLITFPPYWSPFAGHQQLLTSPFRMVPYFHWWPRPLFELVAWGIRKWDRHAHVLRDMQFFRQERLSLRRFEQLARSTGLQILHRRFYLLRPSFKLRYGWPVMEARFIGKIPGLRELLVTGAFYLLKPT